MHRLLEGEVDLGLETATARPGGLGPTPAPEEAREDVPEVGREPAAGAAGEAPATAESREHPPGVVVTPLLRIGERVVRGLHLLEALLGLLVTWVPVGVVLPGQLAVRLLDLVGAGLAPDAENGVEIVVGHVPTYSLTTTRAALRTWPSRR